MNRTLTEPEALALGYLAATHMYRTGETVGVMRMLFTYGLCAGLELFGYRTRFCYNTKEEALKALALWDGVGDPPGPWIKEKGINRETGKPVDRSNPNGVSTTQ